MRIIQENKGGDCFIEFDQNEIDIINKNKSLKLTAESMKHFSNKLVAIAVGLNQHFDERTKNLITEKDQKIEGK